MTARARGIEALGFGALVTLALFLFWWRWTSQTPGLAADQAESLVLARSLVEGSGLRLTPFSAFSAGPSNLAWLGVQALVLRAGYEPLTWLPRISFGFIALAFVVVAFRGVWVWRRPVEVQDALPVVGLSLATATAEAAALGSGGAVWVLALAVVSVLVSRGQASGRTSAAALGLGVLTLIRPSAAWLIVATVPAWWIAARLERRGPTRETAQLFVGALFVAGLVFGFRLAVLGSMPLEGMFPSDEGLAGTLEFLSRQSRWFWAALTGAFIGSVWRRFHLRGGGTLLAWVFMTVVLASWASAARALFLGVVPLLGMLASDGLSAAREGLKGDGSRRGLSWFAIAGLAALLGLASFTSFRLGPIMTVASAPAARPELQDEIGRRGLQQPLVVWSNPVEAAALFPQARVVAVVKPSLAIEDLLMTEGPPDVVDARVPLEVMPRLQGALATGPGGAWWLAELSPDEDPRCPEGRLALLSTTAAQLGTQLIQDVEAEQVLRGLARWRCALAALGSAQLPDSTERRRLAEVVKARSVEFERQGRLELAVRAASLAASVGEEDTQLRARAERLRERWLGAK